MRCILGVLLITLVQTSNSAAAGPTNDEARTINAGIAEVLKNADSTDPTAAHPLSANPLPEPADSPATGLPQPQVKATLRSSPVMFIENVGQFDERARFQVLVVQGPFGWPRMPFGLLSLNVRMLTHWSVLTWSSQVCIAPIWNVKMNSLAV